MPADGIGPEVVTEGVAVRPAVAELHGGLKFETQEYDWGSERYLSEPMTAHDALKVLERQVSTPSWLARWAIDVWLTT